MQETIRGIRRIGTIRNFMNGEASLNGRSPRERHSANATSLTYHHDPPSTSTGPIVIETG